MSNTLPVYVTPATFQKLQRLAVLSGSESAAVERLIAHWETGEGLPRDSAAPLVEVELWHSSTGDVLPVGERLEATDAGTSHYAVVESRGIRYSGKLYGSPSAAARAVKRKRGLVGPSASTNGRDFWKIRHPKSNRLVSIRDLGPNRVEDGKSLLEALRAARSGSREAVEG